MQALRFLTATTILLSLLAALPPPAVAQGACDGTETFEDDANFQPPTGCWYTAATMGTSVVNTVRPYQGSKSLSIPAAQTPGFVITGFSPCEDGASHTATWFMNYDTLPNVVTNVGWGVNVPQNIVIQTSTAGALTLIGGGSSVLIPGITIAPDTWYGFELTATCNAGTLNDDFVGLAWEAANPGGTMTGASLSDLTASGGFSGAGGGFSVFQTSGGSTLQSWLDNLAVPYDDSRRAFCADPSIIDFDGNPATPATSTGASDDYGYNYRRGGNFFDQSEGDDPTGIGLSTGFDYTGSSNAESQWDYSAKNFITGSKALHENLTMEADDQSQTTSNFRVNFHTQAGSNPDDTAKGNGLTTGHFADHLEAEWTETGSTWNIKFHYVNGGGARTQIGGSFNFGDSKDATQFTTWIDTRSTADFTETLDNLYGSNWYQVSTTIQAGPFIAITSESVSDGPSGEQVGVIAIRYLGDISGNPFLDDTVSDVWNVASGSIATGTGWHTAIDENDQENRPNTDDEGDNLDSTCIFDDAGTMVLNGSPGSTPQSQVPVAAPPTSPDDDGCGNAVFCTPGIGGLSSEAMSLFLGIVIVAAFTASMTEKTASGGAGIAFFGICGLIVAYSLGFIQLWVIVVFSILGVAAIFLGIRNGLGRSEV